MNNRKLKSIVLSMGLGAAMLLPASGFAQQRGGGGLFGLGGFFESSESFRADDPEELDGGLFMKNGSDGSALNNEAFGAAGSEIDNEPFGAPIGGGLGILLAAGAGYALIQSKKNKQN